MQQVDLASRVLSIAADWWRISSRPIASAQAFLWDFTLPSERPKGFNLPYCVFQIPGGNDPLYSKFAAAKARFLVLTFLGRRYFAAVCFGSDHAMLRSQIPSTCGRGSGSIGSTHGSSPCSYQFQSIEGSSGAGCTTRGG